MPAAKYPSENWFMVSDSLVLLLGGGG